MEDGEPGQRVEIILNESDRWRNRPLWSAILELLRREGATGATVARGIAGFAGHRPIHSRALERRSTELPLVVTWIDTPSRVARLLPKLREILQGGSLTVQDLTWYRAEHTREPVIATDIRVEDVMTRDVATASPEMPVEEFAQMVAGKNYHGAPVVDAERQVVGVISTTDLAERASPVAGGIGLRPGLKVRDIMSTRVATISPRSTLIEAARVMVDGGYRRLPVVDKKQLVGIISRFDLLRTVSRSIDEEEARPLSGIVSMESPVSEVMRRNVSTVLRDDSLRAVVTTIGSSRAHVAVVVDEWQHVVGLISDAELVEQLAPPSPGPAIAGLARKVKSRRERDEDSERALLAKDLMRPEVVTAFADTPIAQALNTMMEAKQKMLPIVDNAWRFEGVVDRIDLLGWLARS